MVRIHHLNCGTMRPYGLFPFSTLPIFNSGRLFHRGLVVIHCLLIETDQGLVLIDTGFGQKDYTDPLPFVKLFNAVTGLANDPGETAIHQIQDLGFQAEDVKHIFLTHMHLDHTGGLPDFPAARVHVFKTEHQRAVVERGFDSIVYIEDHWAHKPDWELYQHKGEFWQKLPATKRFNFGGLELCFLPTPGHSLGHCMVLAHLPDDHAIIHAGDTYAFHGQIHPDHPIRPRYFRLFAPLFYSHRVIRSMFKYDKKLRALKLELGNRLTIFCAHDPVEFRELSGFPIKGKLLESIKFSGNYPSEWI